MIMGGFTKVVNSMTLKAVDFVPERDHESYIVKRHYFFSKLLLYSMHESAKVSV